MIYPDIGDNVEWVNTITRQPFAGFVERLIVDQDPEPLFLTEQQEWGFVREITSINGVAP